MTNVDAIFKAQREARAHQHPQRLMRVTLECSHLRLLPWNVTGTGIGSRTMCPVCPDKPSRIVVGIEETGVLSDQGARRAGNPDDYEATTGHAITCFAVAGGNPDPDCPCARLCVFCEIIAGRAPATLVAEWPDAIAIIPLGPVVKGHTLVIPRVHVANHGENPQVTGVVATRFAELCARYGEADNHMISNIGEASGQSVSHLHLHYVPRAQGDGVAMPWHSGTRKADR